MSQKIVNELWVWAFSSLFLESWKTSYSPEVSTSNNLFQILFSEICED